MLSQRTASITTRIETIYLNPLCKRKEVREQHPLQQGLRQINKLQINDRLTKVREQHPLQQGLRRYSGVFTSVMNRVREQHPLQQGLRQK